MTAAMSRSLMVQPRPCAAARSSAIGYLRTVKCRCSPIAPVSDVEGARPPVLCERVRTVRADLITDDRR